MIDGINYIGQLPSEIKTNVLLFLDPVSLLSVGIVNKDFKKLSNNDNLWKFHVVDDSSDQFLSYKMKFLRILSDKQSFIRYRKFQLTAVITHFFLFNIFFLKFN